MSDTAALNFRWSQALVAGLAAAGVSHAVISPGSRSTPLALTLLRQAGLACHIIVDERSAAFFALGLAKATRQPVAVLATSGSAPANWLPAVVEADRAGVPLLLLSADRPAELQDCGANQTVPQAAMFAPYVRACHALAAPDAGSDATWLRRLAARAVEQARWPLAGPVHINQPFREPLVPAATPPASAMPPAIQVVPPSPKLPAAAIRELATLLANGPGAIVCGEADYPPGFAAAVTALAARLACPILAEPLSGLRYGPHERSHVLCRYEGWLRNKDFMAVHRPAWLLRFGAFPVTRTLQGFAAAADRIVLVDPQPGWRDPANTTTHLLRVEPQALCEALLAAPLRPAPDTWLATFQRAEAAAVAALPVPAAGEAAYLPPLLATLPADCPLFVGNSMVIRDLDGFGGLGGKALPVFGNRGASGIDGNVSTALGIAAARGQVVAILGDLACQHDLGGLAAARGRQAVFVVFNNGGGGIFEHLPQATLPEFATGWLTPQRIDFAAAAATFGLAYSRAGDIGEFTALFPAALAAEGATLLEVVIDRAASVAYRKAWWQAMATARLG